MIVGGSKAQFQRPKRGSLGPSFIVEWKKEKRK
jgi:hypothetical protein